MGWARTWGTRTCGVVAVTVILLVSGLTAPVAAADDGLPADSPTLSYRTLGLESTLSFYGTQGTQNLTVPVPRGLVPASVNALVELPPNLRSGTITVSQGDRTISRVDVPNTDRAPIVIPLIGAEIVDNALTVVLRSTLFPVEGYCLYDPTIPLRLVDLSLTYAGVEAAPATVADFLPPVLQKLTIFLPEKPTGAESDAAVRLTAATVAHYGKQPTDVTVLALPGGATTPPAPSQPFERQVVIKEGPATGLSLQGAGVPSLLISGPANELTNQARLLSSDISRLALSSKAVVGPLRTSPQLPPDLVTIRDLGQPGVNSTALAPQVSIAVDQTRLGRSVRNVRVHVEGTYTPLPSSVAGSIVVAIGGQTIERWPAEANGVIDRWVNIPDNLLLRYTNLGVAVDIAGNTGRCGEFQPITLTIDGATAVSTQAAVPPAPPGFQSLPQALLPRLEVGIGGDAFADTVRAAQIIEGLQRLSALPMDTHVVPLSEAVNSDLPAVLVSANGWDDKRIQLPVTAGRGNDIQVAGLDGAGGPTTLTLEPSLRFASLQTAYVGNRPVVVATSTAVPAQLDTLLGWLDSDVRRWERLSGEAVLQPEGRDPVLVPSAPTQAQSSSAHADRSWVWWAAGGAAAVLVIGAGLAVLRKRRREPGG